MVSNLSAQSAAIVVTVAAAGIASAATAANSNTLHNESMNPFSWIARKISAYLN